MKDSIIQKLRGFLGGSLDDEPKVVYFLAEARKLLEKYPPAKSPFALKLYCHWALHIDLADPKHTLPFLSRVDAFAGSILSGSSTVTEENRMLREFVLLDTFRSQLREFLQVYDLPTSLCDDEGSWYKFLRHYAGVIEDGSISCHAPNGALKLITGVVFRKSETREKGGQFPFNLAWEISLQDGKTLTVEGNAIELSCGGRILAHKLSLR